MGVKKWVVSPDRALVVEAEDGRVVALFGADQQVAGCALETATEVAEQPSSLARGSLQAHPAPGDSEVRRTTSVAAASITAP